MLLDDRQLAHFFYSGTMYFVKLWVSGMVSHPGEQSFYNPDEAGCLMFTGAVKVSQ
jgi:hypothetical protein